MKNKIFLYLAFIGLMASLLSCEDEADKVYMLDNPIPPSIQTMPELTLERDNGSDTLEFIGTPVDPGFQASARYFLEAAAAGTNFEDPVQVYSGIKAESIKMTVSDLNTILVKKFPADETSTVEFRLRANLVVDAGTGAPGTGTNPFEYISEAKTADVTIYGLPRLDLLNSGVDQKIESPLGDGNYSGFVKLDAAMPFTLLNPDTDTEYGGSGGTLVVDGAGIAVDENGWYKLSADINNLTYEAEPFMIGVVGDATPNGWGAPDLKMDYDPETGTWVLTTDLADGYIKFRMNDDWGWNLGGTEDDLFKDGPDIPVSAGNYTIILTLTGDASGTFEMIKNN
ncbi:SusE domain-containing protein [Anaerophaga thermohalophila]|uniref:SusE domain-containing protein n=1 Tax=Anaerophaga thermohalophila TaxID=177400 RepID=UPI000237C2D4|nr:SusE domain-containing protein [Anaerophaga thermohalophila]